MSTVRDSRNTLVHHKTSNGVSYTAIEVSVASCGDDDDSISVDDILDILSRCHVDSFLR